MTEPQADTRAIVQTIIVVVTRLLPDRRGCRPGERLVDLGASMTEEQRIAIGFRPRTVRGWWFWFRYWSPPAFWWLWLRGRQ
jgi:hypothetical protein